MRVLFPLLMTVTRYSIFSIMLGFLLIAVAYFGFQSASIPSDQQRSYRLIQNAQAAEGEPHLSGQATFDELVASKEGEITVWQGTIFGSATEILDLDKIVFTNSGTATNADVASYTLYSVAENGVLTPIQQNVSPNADAGVEIVFQDSTIVAGANKKLLLSAQLKPNARTGKSIVLHGTASIKASFATGSLSVTRNDAFAERQLLPAAISEVPVGELSFAATGEDVIIEKLVFQLNEIDTSANGYFAKDFSQTDSPDDKNTIKSMSLVKNNETLQIVNSLNANGEAVFEDFDLEIKKGSPTLLEIRVSLNAMDDQDPQALARSGHSVGVVADFNPTKSQVGGVDSTALLSDESIAVENEDTDATSVAALHIFNNRVAINKSASQPTGTLVTGIQKELLKFDAEFTGDTSDAPFLHQVTVSIEGTGGSTVPIDGVVSLYNGNNELVASIVNNGSTPIVLTVGTDAAGIGGLSGSIVADAGALDLPADPIDINGETYTIRADFFTDGADDALTASITVNADGFGQDGIVWIDGGSTGTDGLVVQWIDLGSDSSVTEIANTLSN